MEEENEARINPEDESRVSFVRKRENSRLDPSSLIFYLQIP